MMSPTSGTRGFEEALKELEATVERLESGSLSLEDALAAFERGVGLVRELSAKLDDAESKVEVLLHRDGQGELEVREMTEDDVP